MFTNNNFFGKIEGKSINDFTKGLDYSISSVDGRIAHVEKKLELEKVEDGGPTFAHKYFDEVFEQTFDTQLDKDAVVWVEEEDKFMDYSEFTIWCKNNDVAMDEYLDKTVPFDVIEGDGKWIYSNVNTSNIKLTLNSTDAQYSESNVAKELSRLADYILAKDDKKNEERVEYKFYTDESLFKIECDQFNPYAEVNNGKVIMPFLQDVSKNYKKEKKQRIFSEDRKLPIVEDYNYAIENLRSKLSICKLLELKRDREGLTDRENEKLAYLQKWKGAFIRQIGKLEEDMVITKDSVKGTIYFKAALPDEGETDWNEIDYENIQHVKALLQVRKKIDFTNDLACIVFDLDDAIENTNFTSRERKVLRLYRQGTTISDIAKELESDYWTIEDVVDNICGKIAYTFYKKEENWYYLNISKGKYKKCKICSNIKLATDTYYRKDNKGKLGVRAICKECEKIKRKSIDK